MESITKDGHETCMSSIKLCTDCQNVLKRVEEMDRRLPAMRSLTSKTDHEDSEDQQYFQYVKDFEQSEHFEKVVEEDDDNDSLDHKSTRTNLVESANLGCLLCLWLLNSLDSRSKMTSYSSEVRYRKRPAMVCRYPQTSPLATRCVGHYYVDLLCALGNPLKRLVIVKSGRYSSGHAYQRYRDDQKASLIIDSLRIVSTESPGFIEVMSILGDQSPSNST